MIKNLSIFDLKLFFLIYIFLKKAKKSICNSIGLVLIIIDPKIIFEKLLGLLDLTKAQTLYIYQLTGVFIINKNKDLVFAAFEIVVPGFKGFNNY